MDRLNELLKKWGVIGVYSHDGKQHALYSMIVYRHRIIHVHIHTHIHPHHCIIGTWITFSKRFPITVCTGYSLGSLTMDACENQLACVTWDQAFTCGVDRGHCMMLVLKIGTQSDMAYNQMQMMYYLYHY